MRRAKAAGISILIAVTMLFSVVIGCSVANTIKSRRWVKKQSPEGKMYSVGGHRLFARVTGQGRFAVVFEGDLGSSSPEWWSIQDRLSRDAVVVTYDRAGYGWSDEGPEPRSSLQIVTELETLLTAAGVREPLVLVGHGLGGLYMQHFARRNPGRVRGLVLVEPFSVNEARFKLELPALLYKNLIDRTPTIRAAGFLASIGVIRSFKVVPYLNVDGLETRRLIMENYCQKKLYRAMESEYGRTILLNFQQIAAAGPFPQVPLRVIHHSPEKYRNLLLSFGLSLDEVIRIETISSELHMETARLSARGRYLVSGKSGKNVHFDDPDIIIRSVCDIIY